MAATELSESSVAQGATGNEENYMPLAVRLSGDEKVYKSAGDCVLLPIPEDKYVLLDSGFKDTAEMILKTLNEKGKIIEGVVLTHLDQDHAGGFSELLRLMKNRMEGKRVEMTPGIDKLCESLKWIAFPSLYSDKLNGKDGATATKAKMSESLLERMQWLKTKSSRGDKSNNYKELNGEDASKTVFRFTNGRIVTSRHGKREAKSNAENLITLWYCGNFKPTSLLEEQPEINTNLLTLTQTKLEKSDDVTKEKVSDVLNGDYLDVVNSPNDSSLITLFRAGKSKEQYYLFTGDNTLSSVLKQIAHLPRNVHHFREIAKERGPSLQQGHGYDEIYDTFFGWTDKTIVAKAVEYITSETVKRQDHKFNMFQFPHHGHASGCGQKDVLDATEDNLLEAVLGLESNEKIHKYFQTLRYSLNGTTERWDMFREIVKQVKPSDSLASLLPILDGETVNANENNLPAMLHDIMVREMSYNVLEIFKQITETTEPRPQLNDDQKDIILSRLGKKVDRPKVVERLLDFIVECKRCAVLPEMLNMTDNVYISTAAGNYGLASAKWVLYLIQRTHPEKKIVVTNGFGTELSRKTIQCLFPANETSKQASTPYKEILWSDTRGNTVPEVVGARKDIIAPTAPATPHVHSRPSPGGKGKEIPLPSAVIGTRPTASASPARNTSSDGGGTLNRLKDARKSR